MLRKIIVFLAVLIMPISICANRVSHDFFPVGSKGLSVGGAFTSIADDSGAFYYNPAGLFQLEKKTLSYQLFSALKIEHVFDTGLKLDWAYFPLLSFSFPIEAGKSSWGFYLSTIYKHMFDSYMVQNLGLNFSYKLNDYLALGINAGLALGSQDDNWGFGFYWNLGVLSRLTKNLKFGVVFRSKIKMSWDELLGDYGVKETLPWSIQGGFSYSLDKRFVFSAELEYQAESSTTYSSDNSSVNLDLEGGMFKTIHPHLGVQFLSVATGAQVRVGFMTMGNRSINKIDTEPLLTFGIGAYSWRNFKIDFCLLDSLILDIFTRTIRYERVTISFEYSY